MRIARKGAAASADIERGGPSARASGVPSWIRIALIAAIVLGAIVRFAYLDTKVYSHDETLTSLRTAGYLESEYRAAVSGTTVTVAQLQKYQHANNDRDAGATVRALASDDPQHPPLYYLLERSWDELFGGSIAARRSLGALFGLLTIPAIYWLCRELSSRGLAFALIATALFAVSPFELQYTQQAREYTLWGLMCVVSSALFLRACRTNSAVAWIAYTISIALGMYAHTFFLFVIAAHAITALSMAYRRQAFNWVAFALACLTACCAYAPWAGNMLKNSQTVQATNTWFAAAVPLPVYLYKIFFNVGAVFFDAEYANLLYSFVLVPLFIFVAYALFTVGRTKQFPLGVFVVVLFLTAVVPLLAQDVLHHESRATAARYMLPAFVAIDLAVAYAVALWLRTPGRHAQAANATLAVLLFLGAMSWIVSAHATSWYTASSDAPVLSVAQEIQKKPSALILTNDGMLALQLSNYLQANDRFVIDADAPATFLNASHLNRFVLEPTALACATLARHPEIALDLAYQPTFVDSPMLHMSFMDAPLVRPIFSALRKKLISIHGDYTGVFRLLRVSASADHRTNC